MTYDFTVGAETFSLSVDGLNIGAWEIREQLDSEVTIRKLGSMIIVELSENGYNLAEIKSGDTVNINEVEATGTISDKFDAIKDEIFTASGGEATVQTVYSMKTTITDAQIKTLPSIPVEVIPALGDGKMAVPMFCVVTTNFIADYTNVTGGSKPAYLATDVEDTFTQVSATIPSSRVGNLLLTGQRAVCMSCPLSYINQIDETVDSGDLVNKSAFNDKNICFYIFNNGPTSFTGGDPANTMEITVVYSIVDL